MPSQCPAVGDRNGSDSGRAPRRTGSAARSSQRLFVFSEVEVINFRKPRSFDFGEVSIPVVLSWAG